MWKCGWCWKCWLWSELERERWCWKSRNEESWLAPSCTLDNYSTKPLRPQQQPLIILISSFWQFLPVLAEKNRWWRGYLEILTKTTAFGPSCTMTLTLGAQWLGKTLFCRMDESYVWIVTKSVAITSAWDDLSAPRALPGAASWPDTRSGKILKKCEWRGRGSRDERESPGPGAQARLPGPGRGELIGGERMMMITRPGSI